MQPDIWDSLNWPRYFKTWSYMWGPGLAALVCFFLFKTHHRKTTLQGTNLIKRILAYALFIVILAIREQEPKFLLIGSLGFISILGEELGWRGFLQDALKLKSDLKKALIVGLMWEIWHFTTRFAGNQPLLNGCIRALIFCLIMTTLSYIMIKLTNKTHSLFVAVTVHSVLNAMFEFENAWQAALLCLPLWIWLYFTWEKKLSLSFSRS